MRRLLPCLPLLLSLAACVSSAPPPQPAPPPLAPGALRVMMCEIRDESGTGWVPGFLMRRAIPGAGNAMRSSSTRSITFR
ncbi:hypothetical protein [Paracoccus mutanolyticus]|uniref:hypothetical protein n=1 Tax=Paracoccus mutanolyticus TaxID=1499308 RepID=UPI00167ACB26|nr:hypothetical protein [Paracoccus mutanolyticus]